MDRILHISLPDAREVLERGLRWAVGEAAVWRPEYDAVADWLSDNKGKGLLCFGGNGLGKTVICRDVMGNIFRHYLKKNYLVFTAYEMRGNIGSMKTTCPIYIDDVGVEPVFNDYGVHYEPFTEIIYNAEWYGTLLVLTTNLQPGEIRERYGEKTFDRLRSLVRPVAFTGETMRR